MVEIVSDDRGFFSVDAFFALLLLITVTSGLLTVAQETKQGTQEIARLHEQDMSAEKLAAAINTVYAKGSSLELRFSLPENTLGEKYSLYINSENRIIIVENSKNGLTSPIAKAHIIPSNFSTFTLHPDNLSRTILIRWADNTIKVSG